MKKPKFKPGDVVWYFSVIDITTYITGVTVLGAYVTIKPNSITINYELSNDNYLEEEKLYATFEECKATNRIA